jgi:hypothetical protein
MIARLGERPLQQIVEVCRQHEVESQETRENTQHVVIERRILVRERLTQTGVDQLRLWHTQKDP